MGGFGDYFLHQEYTKIAGLGNKLGEVRDLIDWEKFRPILSDMYRDNKETGGRPHNDEILMIKMHILAGWHGLSDYEVELLATSGFIDLEEPDCVIRAKILHQYIETFLLDLV